MMPALEHEQLLSAERAALTALIFAIALASKLSLWRNF
jgi:hypothetical protein